MDMKGLRKDAIIRVYTQNGKCTTGRYLGVKDGAIRLIQQRKIVVDDKLLGEGKESINLIRCSKDIGQPIEIPEDKAVEWKYAEYSNMYFEGKPHVEDFFWPYFHYRDAYLICNMDEKVIQYNSKGMYKGRVDADNVSSTPNIDETSIPNM